MTVFTLEIKHVTCFKCSVSFGMPSAFYESRKQDHESFWCPAGHEQIFVDKTDEQIKIEELAARLQSEQNERRYFEADSKATHRKNSVLKKEKAGLKGQITKTRNRIKAGLCPYCKRCFVNMAMHMNSKHKNIGKVKP